MAPEGPRKGSDPRDELLAADRRYRRAMEQWLAALNDARAARGLPQRGVARGRLQHAEGELRDVEAELAGLVSAVIQGGEDVGYIRVHPSVAARVEAFGKLPGVAEVWQAIALAFFAMAGERAVELLRVARCPVCTLALAAHLPEDVERCTERGGAEVPDHG